MPGAFNVCPKQQCRGRTDHSTLRHWTPVYLNEAAHAVSAWVRYATCIVVGHDWFSCGVLTASGTWTLYWRCQRCSNTVAVENDQPTPHLLPDSTRPARHAVRV